MPIWNEPTAFKGELTLATTVRRRLAVRGNNADRQNIVLRFQRWRRSARECVFCLNARTEGTKSRFMFLQTHADLSAATG